MNFIKPATSQDVAKLAGVSQSAVSRCFTKGASISTRTKLRVLEAAKKLKYKPTNLLSNSILNENSGLVGVILPYVTSRYYPEVLIELHEALRQAGFRILLITTDDGEELDEKLIQPYLKDKLVAIILQQNQQIHLLKVVYKKEFNLLRIIEVGIFLLSVQLPVTTKTEVK